MSDDHHLGEDLAALALGDTTLREKHQAHMAGCSACRRAVAEAEHVMVALAMPVEAPSVAFDRALWARLDAEDAAEQRSWRARLRAWWSTPARAWGLGLAGVALASLVAVLAVPSLRDPSGPSSEVIQALAAVDDVDLAENLELLEDMELVEELDAIEDLDAIEALDEESAG